MLQIRSSMFETNSSSSNTLILLTTSEYARWKNGDIYVEYNSSNTCTIDELRNRFKEAQYYCADVDEYRLDHDIHSYEEFKESASNIITLEKDGMIAIGFDDYC